MSIGLGVIGTVLGIVWEVLKRLPARKKPPTPEQKAKVAVHDARAASAAGDAAAVNARMERHRVRGRVVRPDKAARLLGCALAIALCGGCPTMQQGDGEQETAAPAVVVIPADRYQYPMTNAAGVAGWFVPAAVHADYCEAVELVEWYETKGGAK